MAEQHVDKASYDMDANTFDSDMYLQKVLKVKTQLNFNVETLYVSQNIPPQYPRRTVRSSR